ncbi:glycosyltransferase, partial [Candidatus Uhrbacteria bacterium]|nr:glycosyltransferase [Candidatus Uhrbacteria bacterium]MBD3284266.1 glycosyltransferase [Candidatus Uhrbacteria bacterium]
LHLKLPNKLWTALSVFGTTSIDHEVQKRINEPFDVVLLTNLGFVGYVKTPYALILHDLSFLIQSSWFPWKMRLWHQAVNPKELARRADRIFTVSETTKLDAVRLLDLPEEQIETFHPGIPTLRVSRSELGGSNDLQLPTPHAQRPTPYVLTIGESDPRKNVRTAIQAVETLRSQPEFEPLQLVIIGSLRTTHHAPRSEWIIRKQRVTDEELASLYQHASAFLYPSWYEGFGLPLHEAAQFNTPCIASTHGSLPETAPDGTLFAPPNKPQLWTGLLKDVLSSPERYSTSTDLRNEQTETQGFIRWIRSVKQKNA